MADPCVPGPDKLKLVRDGSEQGDRFPRALDPAATPVHGNGPDRTMLFASQYAEFLNYYDTSNIRNGDWRVFFERDVSFVLASAAVQDVARYRNVLRTYLDALQDHANADSPELVRRNLSVVFALLGTLAARLDALAKRLPADRSLKATLENLIRARLAKAMKRLVSWFKADQEGANLIQPLPAPSDDADKALSVFGEELRSFSDVVEAGLTATLWGNSASVPSDPSVFGDPAGTPFQKGRACVSHALFVGACDAFLKAYARVVADARTELNATLENYDGHEPHYALFLTFLRMFEYARTDINALGGKHLDFYYRKVLQLNERPAEPSRAHVIVELNKNVSSHELKAGTELKAGKDGKGNPVVFTSDATLVANKAAVASVIRLHRNTEKDVIFVDPATPLGKDSWHPFENEVAVGSFGFAVGSHYLYLAEGERTVTLTITADGTWPDIETELKNTLQCRVTSEDGWLELPISSCEFMDTQTLSIVGVLDGGQPAISAFDADVHEAAYGVTLPILEVKTTALDTIAALEQVFVRSIALNVEVKGQRSLVLSNDLGPIDPSKPFQPFGPSPERGSSLIVGAPEAFSKRGLTTFALSYAWRALPETPVQVSVQQLEKGTWTTHSSDNSEYVVLPSSGSLDMFEFLETSDAAVDVQRVASTPFSVGATSGYVKLRLKENLGHETYAQLLADYVIGTVQGAEPTKPSEPITPELESLTLSYKASQIIQVATDNTLADKTAYDARVARFYHVTSVGQAEQHGFLRAKSDETKVPLLPLLQHRDLVKGKLVSHEGELFLGLSGVEAPQDVSLLFQVVEGSADPLMEKPEHHLHFSYLRNGDWMTLRPDQVADGTSELLASGIITFSIPDDATTHDSLLSGDLTWIRIAVGERTESVCRLMDVRAQAVQVTFSDRENDLAFLAAPLAAGTIGKLGTSVAAIKSASQPYPTFGGRTKETAQSFRARVSERLRHKDRAITLWDIERLVLQAFPGIHRVKCLNHLEYKSTSSGGTYRELAAGHITVVPIATATIGDISERLTPYVSLGVLEEIEAFLQKRLSCFATLHVCNPDYETLRVECKVKLNGGHDETASLKGLQTALTEFLAPWAFDPTRHPTFDGKVYRSALINLLEEQPSVDFVTDVHLYHVASGKAESEAQAVVEGSRAVSVLTSVSAPKHRVVALQIAGMSESAEICGCKS